MLLKLNKSWRGKPAGTIMELDERMFKYAIQNRIGEKHIEPKPKRRKKIEKVEYENKIDKTASNRKIKDDANKDN